MLTISNTFSLSPSVFTILSSWALLSVMTGVVSDSMLQVRYDQEAKDVEAREGEKAKRSRALSWLRTLS